jgi:tetratricopeptide (TPR) repeat protein
MARRQVFARLNVVALALALLFACVAPAGAAGAREEICDVKADLALGLENYPATIAAHLKLLHVHNNNSFAHYHLGFAYGMTGRSADEIREYVEAVTLGLRQWDLFLNLGLAYLGQDDDSHAIEAFQTAVSLGPNHAEAHFNLAIAYERERRFREALQEITASLQLAPLDPDEHNTKATICAELGDLACARNEWTYLVKVAPTYLPAGVNLAILQGSPITFGDQSARRQ